LPRAEAVDLLRRLQLVELGTAIAQ
jgi:hypothetical protein